MQLYSALGALPRQTASARAQALHKPSRRPVRGPWTTLRIAAQASGVQDDLVGPRFSLTLPAGSPVLVVGAGGGFDFFCGSRIDVGPVVGLTDRFHGSVIEEVARVKLPRCKYSHSAGARVRYLAGRRGVPRGSSAS